MKKLVSLILVICFVGCAAVVFADESADVFVSVSVAPDNVPVKLEKITVSDKDSDGVLTIYDAFICAHDAFFEGGSDAGFATVVETWGTRIDKLWGVECGVNCFYYLNNVAAGGLSDPVKTGDVLHAFVYTDTVGFSDTFSYFEKAFDEAETGKAFSLSVSINSYDANWNPVSVPLEGAVITVDGQATNITTDAEGKAQLTFEEAGEHIISAVDGSRILVAPLMRLTVNAAPAQGIDTAPSSETITSSASPDDGDGTLAVGAAGLLAAIASVSLIVVKRKNEI